MTTDDLHAENSAVSGRWIADGGDVFVYVYSDDTSIVASSAVVAGQALSASDTYRQGRDHTWWAPGFVDIQVNGYNGVDYSGPDLCEDDVDRVINALAVTGTTRHVPTVITNSQERICRNLEILHGIADSLPQRRAALAGLHVEGPYISSEDGPRGAHDPRYVRNPDWAEVSEWLAAAGGDLAMVTLAPERPGSIKLIERLVSEGVVVSIGHTAATDDEILAAVDAGASMSTHLGNGSHASLPRLNNYLWTQLAEDRLTAGIIADGFHLPPHALRSIVRGKERSRIILVSDVAPLAGTAPGRKRWGNMEVEVHHDGHVSLAGTPFLAGAGHLLNHNIAQAVRHTDLSLSQAVEACTLRTMDHFRLPGYITSDPSQTEKTEGGAEMFGDLVRFEWREGDRELHVTHAIRDGVVVYRDKSMEVVS